MLLIFGGRCSRCRPPRRLASSSWGRGPSSTVKSSCPADPCGAACRVTGDTRAAPATSRTRTYIRATATSSRSPSRSRSSTDDADRLLQRALRRARRRCACPCCAAATSGRRGSTTVCCGRPDVFEVENYLGSSPTFVLKQPLRVKKDNMVAITVPTWAADLREQPDATSDWWRSSGRRASAARRRSLDQFALEELREVIVFGCTYKRRAAAVHGHLHPGSAADRQDRPEHPQVGV